MQLIFYNFSYWRWFYSTSVRSRRNYEIIAQDHTRIVTAVLTLLLIFDETAVSRTRGAMMIACLRVSSRASQVISTLFNYSTNVNIITGCSPGVQIGQIGNKVVMHIIIAICQDVKKM